MSLEKNLQSPKRKGRVVLPDVVKCIRLFDHDVVVFNPLTAEGIYIYAFGEMDSLTE